MASGLSVCTSEKLPRKTEATGPWCTEQQRSMDIIRVRLRSSEIKKERKKEGKSDSSHHRACEELARCQYAKRAGLGTLLPGDTPHWALHGGVLEGAAAWAVWPCMSFLNLNLPVNDE